MIILIGMVEPFAKKSDRNMALMNEFFCLLVNYHLLIFSDWVPDGPARVTMGYCLITITGLNIVINLFIISVNSIYGVGRVAKMYWKRYRVFQAHKLSKNYIGKKAGRD